MPQVASNAMDAATTHRARRMVPWMVSAAAVLCACGSSAETPSAPQPSTALPVQTGKVERWPEASEHLSVDFDREPANAVLGAARPSGLDAFWSVASTTGAGTGFFYADSFRDSSETRVAHLPSVHRVTDTTLRPSTTRMPRCCRSCNRPRQPHSRAARRARTQWTSCSSYSPGVAPTERRGLLSVAQGACHRRRRAILASCRRVNAGGRGNAPRPGQPCG